MPAKQATNPTPYAKKEDFGQILDQDMSRLYLLAFLLTADRERAVWCFISGLEDLMEGPPVSLEWAHSWARQAIIQQAVRTISPRPSEEHSLLNFNSGGQMLAAGQEALAAVLELKPFERFVYVLSVLERYSDQKCSFLLSCSRRHVMAARIIALQQVRSTVEVEEVS
jgi:hypothetical protein